MPDQQPLAAYKKNNIRASIFPTKGGVKEHHFAFLVKGGQQSLLASTHNL